jgi:hypothetical protein
VTAAEYQLPSIDLPDNCPKFLHLTHLQLMTRSLLDKIDWLSSLPNLTHLLILTPWCNLDAVNPIFARCHWIQLMLWCPWDSWYKFCADHITRRDLLMIDTKLEKLEPRLVVVKFTGHQQYTDHFIAHSDGWWAPPNAWEKGEQIVEKRL